MKTSARVVLLAALALGCAPTAPCPEGTFACVDECLPFGSTCSGSDAGVMEVDVGRTDGGVTSDAFTPRDAPSVGSCTSPDGIPVLRYCASAGATRDCRDGAELPCRANEHCEELLLRDGSGHFAACFAEGSAPCDLRVDAPASCVGAVITRCEATSSFDTRRTINCIDALGWDSATCEAEGTGFTCVAPEATACTPPLAPRCEGERLVTCRRASTTEPVLTRQACGLGERCVESRIDAHGFCAGDDARSTERPPVRGPRAERCVNETTVEVESEGLLFSRACPITRHLGGDGMSIQTLCTVDGVGRYACVDPPLVACTGTSSTCTVGATGDSVARTCVDQGDGRRVLVDRACSLATLEGEGVVTGCTEGGCRNVGACSASDAPTCIDRYRVFCEDGRWAAASCAAGCAAGACIP